MTAKLDGTHPILRERVLKVLAQCKLANLNVYVFEGLRTKERQKILYDTGKSKTLHSYHIIGLAADLVFKDVNGNWTWSVPPAKWSKLSEIMVACGLESGHLWSTFVDSPHCQLRIEGYTGAQLHAEFTKQGKLKFNKFISSKLLK